MAILQNRFTCLQILFFSSAYFVYLCATCCSSQVKFSLNATLTQKRQIRKMLSEFSKSSILAILIVLIIRKPIWSCYLLSSITTKNMAKLQHTVTRLWIIVFSCFYGGYRQRGILELVPRNPHLTPLRTKAWPVFKIFSSASESSLSGSLTVLIIRATI